MGATNNAGGPIDIVQPPSQYVTCAPSATTPLVAANGAAGDYIENLLCVVSTPATSAVQIQDGTGTTIGVLPNGVAGGIGTYPIPIRMKSKTGSWKVICGAGVMVIATGSFA